MNWFLVKNSEGDTLTNLDQVNFIDITDDEVKMYFTCGVIKTFSGLSESFRNSLIKEIWND